MKGYGTSKTLNINLNDSDSVNRAINSMLNVGINRLEYKVTELITDVVNESTEYAKSVVPVDTGALKSGISGEVKNHKGTITGTVTAMSDHAAYVEFGVGVVGEGTYPGDTQGWQYNVPSMFKDETGGWHYGKGYGIYTHGNVANPFMYKTARYMRSIVPMIAKEINDDYT